MTVTRKKIEELLSRRNDAMAAVNDAIEEAEKLLEGVNIAVEVCRDHGGQPPGRVWLAYKRVSAGRWTIHVRHAVSGVDEMTPLRDAPIETRAVAVAALPELVAAATQRLADVVDHAERAALEEGD